MRETVIISNGSRILPCPLGLKNDLKTTIVFLTFFEKYCLFFLRALVFAFFWCHRGAMLLCVSFFLFLFFSFTRHGNCRIVTRYLQLSVTTSKLKLSFKKFIVNVSRRGLRGRWIKQRVWTLTLKLTFLLALENSLHTDLHIEKTFRPFVKSRNELG